VDKEISQRLTFIRTPLLFLVVTFIVNDLKNFVACHRISYVTLGMSLCPRGKYSPAIACARLAQSPLKYSGLGLTSCVTPLGYLIISVVAFIYTDLLFCGFCQLFLPSSSTHPHRWCRKVYSLPNA